MELQSSGHGPLTFCLLNVTSMAVSSVGHVSANFLLMCIIYAKGSKRIKNSC